MTQPSPTTPIGVVVAATSRTTADVVKLTLVARPGAGALAPWAPGAHVDLRTETGQVRQYSLCGDPDDQSTYTVAVRREQSGRGVSKDLHDATVAGRELQITAVRNTFPFDPAARAYLFLAGGIGITPLLPMLRAAHNRRAPWRLVYIGRGLAHMPFREELEAFGARVEVVDTETQPRPDLAAVMAGLAAGTQVYACGPPGMLEEVLGAQMATQGNVQVAVERFVAAEEADTEGGAFQVVAARSGATVEVPVGCTILEVLRAVVPDLPYSCEEGYCGTCETRVLAGVADHRDSYLDDDERKMNESMMICVSRSVTPQITLDI